MRTAGESGVVKRGRHIPTSRHVPRSIHHDGREPAPASRRDLSPPNYIYCTTSDPFQPSHGFRLILLHKRVDDGIQVRNTRGGDPLSV